MPRKLIMRVVFILIVAASLSACDRSSSVQPQAESPARFEVRDFKTDTIKEEGSVLVKGRGTLMTKDPRLAQGNFIIGHA